MSFGFGIGDFLAILQLAQSVRGKWIDAPPEYASIKNEIKNAENIIRDINELGSQSELTSQELQNLNEASQSCLPILETCNKIVDNYVSVTDPGTGARNRLRRSWKRFKLDPDDIRHARDQLSSVITQLTAIEAAIQIRLTSDMQDAVDDLLESDEQRERERVADWYASSAFATQYMEYSRIRQHGTGRWFLQDDRYMQWREGSKTSSGSTLLCPGIPGSGKTMMMSAIIDDLHTYVGNREGYAVAYFYCNFNRREQQELYDIYSSLARQLFQEQLVVPKEVKTLYLKHRDRQTRPSIGELSALLKDLIQRHKRVYILIDALDECNISSRTREQLLQGLFGIQADSDNVNLLATTRFIPEIMQMFTKCEKIEVQATKEDLERYLDNRISELASFVQRKPDLWHEIKSKIIELVDGMFLLARLHFEALLGYTNATKLRGALRALPSGKDALSKAYDIALERIDHQIKPQADLARHVLTWLINARRELAIDELQEAIVVSMTPGKTDIDHGDDLDAPEEILSVCAGLVVLDGETGIVRLVHYTTQAYLENVQDRWLPDARNDVARSCIDYLSFESFLQVDFAHVLFTEALKRDWKAYKLLEYMAFNWGYHVADVNDANIQEQALDFLRDKHKSRIAIDPIDNRIARFAQPGRKGGVTAIHVCSYFNMSIVGGRLIEINESYNDRDCSENTPLAWAAVHGSLDMVELLLRQPQVGVNSRGFNGETPLVQAVSGNHYKIVELLLRQPGIDINLGNDDYKTPLFKAAQKGHRDMVELLLRQPGINFNLSAIRLYHDTPLHIAADRHPAVVELLLHHLGIDVNPEDTWGRTPLSVAAKGGKGDVVELLLRHPDVDVNHEDEDILTPLFFAVDYENRDAVDLLLRHPNIDVKCEDTHGRTPLWIAARRGYRDIVELLLRHPRMDVNAKGMDANAKDMYSDSPLSIAVSEGNRDIVELLLLRPDIGVNSKNDRGETPLLLAVKRGNKDIVELLLGKSDINVNLPDNNGKTPFTHAESNGHKEILELLLTAIQGRVSELVSMSPAGHS